MADIQVMINAAYDAYEKVKADVNILTIQIRKLTEENAELKKQLEAKEDSESSPKKEGNTDG